MEKERIAGGGVQYVPQIAVQYVYLDFDGELTDYNGEILTVENVEVKDSALTKERINSIVAELNAKYASQNVIFVTDRPVSAEYSTIFIGKTDAFSSYGNFAGLAETIDEGNKNSTDKAFVMLDSTNSNEAIISTISHETDHLLGTLSHGGDGLQSYAAQTIIGSGTTSTGLIVSSSNSVVISSGGTANSTTVNSGGYMRISSGGTANSTTVNSGGKIRISSGGVANSTILSGGEYVSNRPNGGVTCTNPGVMDVLAGGYASNTIISYGGTALISSGAVADGVQVTSYGMLKVYSGGVANDVITSNWCWIAISGGTLNNFVNSGGFLEIHSGGVVNNATQTGGYMFIYSDGMVNSTTVNSGCWMNISSGGSAENTTVNSGGSMSIASGGTATGINIISGGRLEFTVAQDTYIQGSSNGSAFEVKNGFISGYTVNSGGFMYISSGGLAENTTVNLVGSMHINFGGTATSTTVNSGGRMNISSGGSAENTTVNSGGSMFISSGGIATGINVIFGGRIGLTVAQDTYIQGSSNGSAFEMKNGFISGYTVNSFGRMYISSGGLAENTTVNSECWMHISSGGSANSTTVNVLGRMYISSGGSAENTTVNLGCSMHINFGGTATRTTVNSGGRMYISSGGSAENTTVNSGGSMSISSGGIATGINVISGGRLGFTVAQDTYIQGSSNGSAFEMKNGFISGYTVNSGGYMSIFSGGTATRTTVNFSGRILIYSGCLADNTTVNSGGDMFVYFGGLADNTTVNSGGFMYISSGGLADNTTVNSGGIINISSGAFIDGVNLNSGAVLKVLSGGSAVISAYNGGVISAYQGAVITAFGLSIASNMILTADNGWNLTQTTVENGGILTVESGGRAESSFVESGGYLTLQTGAVISGVSIESGGYVENAEDTSIHKLTLFAGASFAGLTNKNDCNIEIDSVTGNVVSGKLQDAELAGTLTVGSGTVLSGLSGEFTLNILSAEDVSISGNDFSKVKIVYHGSGQIDLSGNYWGTTDIDAIYAELGVDQTVVKIDDVLSGNPSSDVFTIESTDLVKNALAAGKTQITVVFSAEIDAATVSLSAISFVSSSGAKVNVKNVSVNGNKLVVTFDPICKDGNYSLKFADSVADIYGRKLTSTRYSDAGAGVGDLLRLNVSISGPAVKQVVPAGDIAGVISAFQVYFTKSVDPATLKKNVKLIAPDGSEISPSAIRMITDSIAEFIVAEQTANGKYSVFVSADVADYAGNKLNCSGNDVNGEADDNYTGLFNLTEIDLTIRDVKLDTALTPGKKCAVTWNVVNESGTALSGNWTDGIYLSTDDKWDISDKLLATYNHENGLLAGEILNGSAEIALSGVSEGSYYILVRSDIYNDEKAGTSAAEEAQNLVATAITVSLPELTIGSAEKGTFTGSGDFAVYKFTQQNGQAMTVDLESLASAANMELYIGYGSAPTRENYDAKLQRITDGSLTLNAPVSSRDVYVMVYAKNINGSMDYNLTAAIAPLTVNKITQSSQDSSKEIILTITGVNFTDATGVTLKDANGSSYTPAQVTRSGSSKLVAIIGADALEQGSYTVVVSGKTSVESKNAVTVADAGEGKFEYSFYAPAKVGRHSVHTLSITCSNTGTAEIDAPLVFFTPTQSHADGSETMGASLTLDSKKVNAGFWVSSQPEGFSDSLSFFVSGEVAGTLQPGETVKVPITYTGWQHDDWDFGDSHINWNVSVLYAEDTTELKWSDVFAASNFSESVKTIISEAFTADFGDTWGGYCTMVVANMKSQSNIGNVASVNDSSLFLYFEVMQKAGLLQPFANMISDCDLIVKGNSVDIELTRSYSADLLSRGEVGSFGYGWSCNWDIRVQIDESGDIRVIQGGKSRLYQPTYMDSFQTANNDGSVLKKNLSGYKLTDADGKVWQFDAHGRLLTMTGKNNERISCSYGADGLLNRLTNTVTGSYVIFTRNEAGFITSAKSSSGNTISYTYNEDGDLLTVTDSLKGVLDSYEYYAASEHALTKAVSGKETVQYTYDNAGLISSLTTANGTIQMSYGDSGELTLTSGENSVTLCFDLLGNIARITDNVSGKEYRYTYADGALVSGMDSDGNMLGNTFEFAGLVFNVSYSGKNIADVEFNATYNTSRNSNYFVVDGITYYKTDAEGNILGKNDNASEYYLAGYDENNKLVSYEYLKNGVTTTYTLTADGGYQITEDDPSTYFVVDGIKYFKKDMQGNVLDQSDTTTDSYTLGYDADGNRVYYGTTQNGKTTSYHYDIAGNLISLTDENGTTKYTYDASGNKISELRPDGSSYLYDANGKVTSFTDADGEVTSYTYDANGNLASVTTNGKTLSYTYSEDGKNLLGMTDERGNVYSYTYDSEGRRVSETLNGKTTSYTYDENGNYATITNPANETTSYVYDANGNLTLFTDSQGNSITYTYSGESLLVKTTYADGTFESYTYDADGNITNWTGRAGQTANYTVNSDGYTTGINYSDGRTISVSYNADGFMTSANDISFAYDENGNLTRQSFADGRNITYTYNSDGYITSYADELGHAVNYTYTVDGGYDKLTDENGALIIDYDYDEAGFLTKATKGNGTYTLYGYNEYGEVTAIDNYSAAGVLESFTRYTYNSEGQRTAMTTQDGAWAYTYDAKNQLIAAQFTDNKGNVTQNFAYTYDAMGNRLTSTENGVTTTYTYNNLNQIVSANGFTYRYDANGNLLEDEERIYTWTADNRVASEKLKSTGQIWEYGYDAMGNRVSSKTNGVTTSWTVDSSGNVLAEYVDGVWNRTYYQGSLLAGFTDKAGNEYYFNPDALGTTVSVTGAAGNAVNNYTYDPFGNTITVNETIANDFEFVGGYGLMANDSGTIFVRARNYDPETGRWISPDPIGISGGENLYVYCVNDVINKIDINGYNYITALAHVSVRLHFDGDGHCGIGVFGNYLGKQPLGDDEDTLEEWFSYWSKHSYSEYSIFASDDMIDKMARAITIYNNGGHWVDWWGPGGHCVSEVADTLRKGGYYIPQVSVVINVVNDFDEFLRSPGFIEQQRKKYFFSIGNNDQFTWTKAGYRTFTTSFSYGSKSLVTKSYVFTVNEAPTANVSFTAQTQFTAKNEGEYGSVILNAKDSIDNGGIQDSGSVRYYSWYYMGEDNVWHHIANTNKEEYTYSQHKVGTTVKYGLVVTDNDEDISRNGQQVCVEDTFMPSVTGGTYIATLLSTDVTLKPTFFVPSISCNDPDGSVQLKDGEEFTFVLTGSAKTIGNTNVTVTNYDWSVGSGNTSTRSITVTAAEETDDNGEKQITYTWYYGGKEIGNGSSYHVTLGVTANGKESENRAGITLSVGSNVSGSVDPNDKTVLEGVGEKGYISAGSKLSYKLEFENDPEFATAPAQWVRVFDTLDGTKYDLDSFELQNFCIAGNYIEVGDGRDSYNQTVKLKIYDYTVTANIGINLVTDEETGVTQLVAEFMAIDPETGFMLMDQVNGMLPVNDAIGSGEGYINYTINAKKDLAHGTEITNTAKIYFDFNDPIDTPTTLNTIDLVKPTNSFTLSETDGIVTIKFTGKDADSGIAGYNVQYSTDGVNFSDYGYSTYDQLNIAGTVGTTCYFKVQAVDKVGNASAWSKVQSVKVLGTLPENLSGSADGLTWDAISGTAGYVVEYSIDDFAHFVRLYTTTNRVNSFCLPQGSYQWRVRTIESDAWVTGSKIAASAAAAPKLIDPEADGNTDIFFANANGIWSKFYSAEHQGLLNGWKGTKEQVKLTGKNKIADVFKGSSDANVLVLTDDSNGDALFVDDVYTSFGKDAARISQIDEIRAGVGDDIIDLTSQKFAYAGEGVKVYGGVGNDTIWANKGKNLLFGDAGNDRIVGGSDNDVIIGGSGNDSMHGGGGEDIFTFGGNWGKDTITQLADGKVTLWFEDGSASKWNASTLTYTDGTNSVKVTGIASDKISLKFGGDTSDLPDGAFAEAASEKIFEDKNKGMLA